MKNDILVKPVITEKMTTATETLNRFGFIVDKNSNKLEIKAAIEEVYGVTVTKVRTMRYGGGKANTKYTSKGMISQKAKLIKKAIVELAEGETIDLYGNL